MTAATLVDALRESMRRSMRAPDGEAAPAALLWTDPDRQWSALVPALMKAMPELFALGEYAPDERRGPVVWLKCVVDRSLPDAAAPDGAAPALYLPGVGRGDLRDADACPPALRPLVELQYRGAIWRQRNGRDWTVEAFLSSGDSLGLDVARDAETRAAMLRVLAQLAAEPLAALRGRRLEAEDFDRIAIGDPIRNLLDWMNAAEDFETARGADGWAAFRDVCRRRFGFDPRDDGAGAAADALAAGGGEWDEVWRRFADAPAAYPGVAAALRAAKPRDLLAPVDPSRSPGLNEQREDLLRAALGAAAGLPHAEARARVAELEREHVERRGWVWAQIGESPCALALEPLARLARAAGRPLGGATAADAAADYAAAGWRCDRAALDALATAPPAERETVAGAVRALYAPWLDAAARRFQELLAAEADPGALAAGVDAEPGCCLVFVDGLRFDVGAALRDELKTRGMEAALSFRIAPLPTVTATAKPLASPAHSECAGAGEAENFLPAIAADGKPADTGRLRAAIARRGAAVLEPGRAGAPGANAAAWTETAQIDSLGHKLGAGLAPMIAEQVAAAADRIEALLDAGWPRVRAVTDHGWLLLPGGLPRVDLPPALVATKWARCAAVGGASEPSVPTWPWRWDPVRRIAAPPGAGAFRSGVEYAHGGVSPQECVTPDIVATRGAAAAARILDVSWRGMRCRVAVAAEAPGVTVDLRLNRRRADSSIAAAPRTPNAKGQASLVVPDDGHEGAAALVVAVGADGRVLDESPTTVGGDR